MITNPDRLLTDSGWRSRMPDNNYWDSAWGQAAGGLIYGTMFHEGYMYVSNTDWWTNRPWRDWWTKEGVTEMAKT